ncbi:hypothetical protein EQG61_08480 [Flavobacterium stagni]|uniref:Uncharacterized protein n=1 Tax=Flavobacterium stagni TaxID=2506421 RepID=A0A4Q1KAI9_9FLAO|nr:hypothetical protein EQG61_08480 [Flavobacterium stagni]
MGGKVEKVERWRKGKGKGCNECKLIVYCSLACRQIDSLTHCHTYLPAGRLTH